MTSDFTPPPSNEDLLARDLCQLQDALGCPCEDCDCQEKAMERIRDLVAAEAEGVEAKDLLRQVHRWFLQQAPEHYKGCGLCLDVHDFLCEPTMEQPPSDN